MEQNTHSEPATIARALQDKKLMERESIISYLNLTLLEREGGYFSEIYRSEESIDTSRLPARYKSKRSLSSAIYYLLTPKTISCIHRLLSDELFHFYHGDPVEMLQLFPDGSGEIITLGSDILNGMQVQITVPHGVWQGAKLKPGGNYALMGTTMAPGFDWDDFEPGDRCELMKQYPAYRDRILELTDKSEQNGVRP